MHIQSIRILKGLQANNSVMNWEVLDGEKYNTVLPLVALHMVYFK